MSASAATAAAPNQWCPRQRCQRVATTRAQRHGLQRAAAARRLAQSAAGWREPPAAAAAAAARQDASPSSSSSTDTAAALAGLRYVSPCGHWVVRPMDKSSVAEVRRVVALQTEAFHTTPPIGLLDGMTKRFFEAEVLSEMQKKLKFNPDDLFSSLVVEPSDPAAAMLNGSSNGSSSSNVIGGVEISYIAQKDTLALLEPGTEGYCYIASMVVAPDWRRRGAAAALLAAAEAAAAAWDERQAVLHVYQDNEAAVSLYQRQGYEVVYAQKKGWGTLGARPRYTMLKRW